MTHSTLPDLEKIEVSRKKLDDFTKENFISNYTLANLKKKIITKLRLDGYAEFRLSNNRLCLSDNP